MTECNSNKSGIPEWMINKPDWLIEYEVWYKKKEPELIKKNAAGHHPTLADMGKTRVSDLISCAQHARQRPEIWGKFLALKERVAEDPDASLPNNDIHLIGRFSNWFRMKNNLENNRVAYSYLPGLLTKYALGEISETDDQGAKRWLLQFPFVSDD